jgi:hypothetical protein
VIRNRRRSLSTPASLFLVTDADQLFLSLRLDAKLLD